jgi:hypothetical protein
MKGDPMSEQQAKRHLQTMLRSLTIGSILHLLAEAHRNQVEEAGQADDPVAKGRCEIADHVLFCTGIGLDAALPTR